MDQTMMSAREYLTRHQPTYRNDRRLTQRLGTLAKRLSLASGALPGVQTGKVMGGSHGGTPANTLYQVGTYPRAILEAAFREIKG